MSVTIPRPAWAAVLPARAALAAAVLAGLGMGALLGAEAPPVPDPALLTLLRFMAAVKAALALGAAGAAWWRLRDAAGPGMVAAYAASAGVMAAGLWPIASGAHVALGGMLVHGGLIAGGITAWRDRAAFLPRLRGWGVPRPPGPPPRRR